MCGLLLSAVRNVSFIRKTPEIIGIREGTEYGKKKRSEEE